MGNCRTAVLAAGLVVCLLAGCGGDDDGDSRASKPAVPETFAGFIGGSPGIDTGGLFSEPSDVAVYPGRNDGPGDDKIFVTEADRGRSGRVQRLDSDGNFELAWGRDVVRAGASGDTGTGPEICRHARSCQAAPPGSAAGAFRQPTGVAVDNRTGHIYVADTGNLRVQEFGADGEFVRAWGWGVATGAAAFEVCTATCRAGRHGKTEGDGNAGQFAPVPTAGIAVHPGRGDVLVSDGGNSRVLQFAPGGRFIRAWGAGVASGSRRFETCTPDGGCQTGKPGARWVAPGSWPRQLAIDANGIVYAADDRVHSQVLRFDVDKAPDGEDAGSALLRPLPSAGQTGRANNMGLDIEPTNGQLVTLWNPFGPMVLDVVANPGATDDVHWQERRSTLGLGFMRSTYGIAVSPTTGVLYVAKSEHFNPRDAEGMFDTCEVAGAEERSCHGLILMGADHSPRVTVERARRTNATNATLAGTVTTSGVVTYTFQISEEGAPWTHVGATRHVTAAETRPVSAIVRGLEPGVPYRARILLMWFDGTDNAYEHLAASPVTIGD